MSSLITHHFRNKTLFEQKKCTPEEVVINQKLIHYLVYNDGGKFVLKKPIIII